MIGNKGLKKNPAMKIFHFRLESKIPLGSLLEYFLRFLGHCFCTQRLSGPMYGLFFLLSIQALPACAQIKNPDTYTYVTTGDADSMDPSWPYDTASFAVISNVYETLFSFERDSTQRMVPLLASVVPSRENGLISADGRTYTIPIKKGIHFQDGSLLTPEDIRYSILRFMLRDRSSGPSSLLLEPLLGYPSTRDEKGNLKTAAYKDATHAVQLKGDRIVLHLPTPFAPLNSIFCQWSPIVSKAWAVQHGDWDGTESSWPRFNNSARESSPLHLQSNGTGPYSLESWDRKIHQVVLLRNDKYWRKPARLKRIFIKNVGDLATRKLMLESGDADNISVPRYALRQFKNSPEITVIDGLKSLASGAVIFFTFHINSVGNSNIGTGRLEENGIPADFFIDKDARKAFAYAIDYQGIIRDLMQNKGHQSTGCIPDMLLGHNPGQKNYNFDLLKSEEHLKKAWGGNLWKTGFQLTLGYHNGDESAGIICQMIKRNIEKLNTKFHLNVRGLEWPTFLDNLQASKMPVFLMAWTADYPDPHNFAFPFMHSKGDYPGQQKYANPEADALIDKAVRELDPKKRSTLYARLQEIEYEEAPHINIAEGVAFRIQRSWVKGWSYNPLFPDAPAGSYYYDLWKE